MQDSSMNPLVKSPITWQSLSHDRLPSLIQRCLKKERKEKKNEINKQLNQLINQSIQ